MSHWTNPTQETKLQNPLHKLNLPTRIIYVVPSLSTIILAGGEEKGAGFFARSQQSQRYLLHPSYFGITTT